MINDTYVIGSPGITAPCFEWCQDQFFIHQNNMTLEALFLIALAMIALFIYFIYMTFKDYISLAPGALRIIYMLPEFALYMLMGFIVWYLWLKG